MEQLTVNYFLKKVEKELLKFPHQLGDGDIKINIEITITPNKDEAKN